ncbi:sigma factor [Psychrobacillus sp. FSL K6-1415]
MQITNELYQQYKRLLFSIGYRMLGSVVEAEDLLHEVF